MTDLEEKKEGKGEERRGKKKTKYKGYLPYYLCLGSSAFFLLHS